MTLQYHLQLSLFFTNVRTRRGESSPSTPTAVVHPVSRKLQLITATLLHTVDSAGASYTTLSLLVYVKFERWDFRRHD